MELKKQPPPAPNQGARDCDMDAPDLLPCRLSMVQMRAFVNCNLYVAINTGFIDFYGIIDGHH
jgi:hypothetical protein